MDTTPLPRSIFDHRASLADAPPADEAMNSQINWLELARFAAEGEGHGDLNRGIQRLATLAAAVHRHEFAVVAPERPAADPIGGRR